MRRIKFPPLPLRFGVQGLRGGTSVSEREPSDVRLNLLSHAFLSYPIPVTMSNWVSSSASSQQKSYSTEVSHKST